MSGEVLRALWSGGPDRFVEALGSLFEHSPWVVRRAFARGPFADEEALIAACGAVLAAAAPEERLGLIRAHPELAGKALAEGALTAASTAEQQTAGLDRLTPSEFERLGALNAAYGRRFGFPFVICVRRSEKALIFSALERRLDQTVESETETALQEILAIGRLRLADRLAEAGAGRGP